MASHMRHLSKAAIVPWLVATFLALAIPGRALADNETSQWDRFQRQESARSSTVADNSTPGSAGAGSSAAGQFQPVQKGYFTVPGYFANTPKPYERPTETFRSPTLLEGSAQANSGLNSFAVALPLTAGSGFGYGIGSPWGGWRSGYSSWGGGPAGYGGWGGGSPWSGYSSWGGGPAGYGGWGGGSPWSGYSSWGGGPAGYGGWGGGSPWSGGSAWGGYGGWGGAAALGASAVFSAGSSGNGVVTPTNVIQSAPSKASGNYYSPSTTDTSASGSYYATTAPAAVPYIQQQAPVTNFWGASSSPLPKDINSVPWAK